MTIYHNIIAGKLITLAGKYEGYVRGNFVKNVIIPQMDNKCYYPEITELDFWFKNFNNFTDFTRKLLNIVDWRWIDSSHEKPKYSILCESYEILIVLNFKIGENYRFSPFDVDKLLFSASESGYFPLNLSKKTDMLIKNVKNKIVRVDRNYIINNDNSFTKINSKFLTNGWIVKVKISQNPWFNEKFIKIINKYNEDVNIIKIMYTKNGKYDWFYLETEAIRFKLLFQEYNFRYIIENDNTTKHLTDKDIMLYIFDQGLAAINSHINVTDGKLQYIYDNGENKCREDFENLINNK